MPWRHFYFFLPRFFVSCLASGLYCGLGAFGTGAPGFPDEVVQKQVLEAVRSLKIQAFLQICKNRYGKNLESVHGFCNTVGLERRKIMFCKSVSRKCQLNNTNRNNKHMRNTIHSAMVLICSCCLLPGSAVADKPNIVFIMADDLGYGSVGCYGADSKLVRTPAIDSLADQGLRFTDASTPSSICSPTRYGTLMGRYPWRTSLKYGVVNVGGPLLPDPARTSIAAYLKQQGYRTAAIGKWHLGYGTKDHQQPKDWTKPLRPGPLELGFDYHFGVPQNHGDITGIYIENDRIYGLQSDKVFPYSRSFYGAPYMGFDAPQRVNKSVMADLTDKAVQWLKRPSNDPFFLFFTPVAVHHPASSGIASWSFSRTS